MKNNTPDPKVKYPGFELDAEWKLQDSGIFYGDGIVVITMQYRINLQNETKPHTVVASVTLKVKESKEAPDGFKDLTVQEFFSETELDVKQHAVQWANTQLNHISFLLLNSYEFLNTYKDSAKIWTPKGLR